MKLQKSMMALASLAAAALLIAGCHSSSDAPAAGAMVNQTKTIQATQQQAVQNNSTIPADVRAHLPGGAGHPMGPTQ